MKKTIFSILAASIVGLTAFAQDGGNGKVSVIDNASVKVKEFNARQSYLAGDLTTALRLYNEVLKVKPNDAEVAFHIGECYQEQGDDAKAVDFFEKAEKENSDCDDDLHLKLGQSYLITEQVDNAIKELQAYKTKFASSPKKLELSDVDHYLTQCENAKRLMAHPVKAVVTNLGVAVNTSYDEKSPSVTADGRTLIFTSQRPLMMSKEGKNGEMELLDNVYISQWDSAKGKWGLSYPVEGDVNEAGGKTSCTSISDDGMQMFLYKNNNTDALGGDIYVSRRTHSGRWGQPHSIGHPINSTYYEDCACLSPDGNSLYFMSERPGGFGQGDIYVSAKIGKAEWGQPVNLGKVINTKYDEGGLSMAPDGKTLFFSSNGDGSMGSYDIFKTVMTDSGKWSKPVNLGYPINTVSTDVSFTISADAKMAYFASNRKGGMGGRDIYMVDLSSYPVLAADSAKSAPTGMSILRGTVTNQKNKPIEEAMVIINDSAGNRVASLKTNSEGMYFITLKANCSYRLRISARGYKSFSKPIKLPVSPVGTYTMTENAVLEKR